MTRKQQYDVAHAKAAAAADCATAVRMLVVQQGVANGVKNAEAYRNEMSAICDDLTRDAYDAQDDAEILRPT